jgi:hypothetical protein
MPVQLPHELADLRREVAAQRGLDERAATILTGSTVAEIGFVALRGPCWAGLSFPAWCAPGKNRTCARGLGNRCSIH